MIQAGSLTSELTSDLHYYLNNNTFRLSDVITTSEATGDKLYLGAPGPFSLYHGPAPQLPVSRASRHLTLGFRYAVSLFFVQLSLYCVYIGHGVSK